MRQAYRREAKKWLVRLPRKVMQRLGIEIGDAVEIIGRKVTVAIAWPLRPSDETEDIIRMGSIIRKNAGVSLDEVVYVRKTELKEAELVKLAPQSGITLGKGGRTLRTIKDALIDVPMAEGDIIQIPFTHAFVGMSGGEIYAVVLQTKPRGPVRVTEKTQIKLVEKHDVMLSIPRVTYEDIGGLGDAIQKIRELVEIPLRYPQLFRYLGIDPPKGILLYGPPGTGKTLLAKAVASESDAYFIAINGPEIMSKYYGESEQKLREVFEEAKRRAPSIIFIDEIDAIAPKREEVVGEVEKRVVAQLLTLMDGLEGRGDVIVIGATNRPNAVDPALRRPGRFDREIEVPIPDKKGRLEILEVHTRNVPLADDVDLEKIAELTHGYTGADLAALVKEAAMSALRRFLPNIEANEGIPYEKLGELEITMADFMYALRSIQPSGLREVMIEVPTVKWDDIGGLEEVKRVLKEIAVLPLQSPGVFERMGIRPPRGILLYGPPGCGKTLLAKAVATESGANFIAIKGPEILSKWVGESEKAIREIFRKARLYSPAIVFFDEIDAIAPTRGYHSDAGVSDRIVNQLLAEMDGIQTLKNVVVIAATNRPDLVDPALLRPGRFDRVIYVPPPDKRARLEILKVHTRKVPLADDVDLERIAELTKGYTGADLEALVREAALTAIREDINAMEVSMRHFVESMKSVQPSLNGSLLKFYESWQRVLKQRLPRSITHSPMSL